jgi:poly(A) polymerase
MDKRDFKLAIESRRPSILATVSKLLTGQGIKSYLVGGFVRDVLLKRDTADIDIAVIGNALEIAPRVAAALGGKYILLDEINMVCRVIVADEEGQRELDFSTVENNIEQDLARRDFTIDAMAIDLSQLGEDYTEAQLIDPFHGWKDLHQGVVRAVTRTAFEADAARLLRAVRLAAELSFSIAQETESLIQRYSHLIANVAGERIREELLRLLAVSNRQLLLYLDGLGLLTAIIPELQQLKGAEQPKEHFWDVFNHSIETVVATDFILHNGDWEYVNSEEVLAAVPWSAALAQHFDLEVSSGSNRRLLLKLAALLHDIAKPQTRTINEDGRMRFLGHAKEGAAIAVNILERLRFSSKEIKLVEVMVRHHLRPGQMSQEGLPSHKAIYRYFRDTGEAGIDILFLNLADHLATRGPNLHLAYWQEHAQMVDYVLTQHFQQETLAAPPKLVDGYDLIKAFGLKPGPRIGEILEAVREAQASGELTTKQEALDYVREHLLSYV